MITGVSLDPLKNNIQNLSSLCYARESLQKIPIGDNTGTSDIRNPNVERAAGVTNSKASEAKRSWREGQETLLGKPKFDCTGGSLGTHICN